MAKKLLYTTQQLFGYSGAAEPPFRRSEYRESGTAYRQVYS